MLARLLVGLAALLGMFLLIRTLWRKGQVVSEPDPIKRAFNDVFDLSEYKATKDNWIDVSRMETAGWTSKLFINGLNLWGMKKARKRPNTQSTTLFGIAGRESVSDLFPNITEAANKITGQSEWAKYENLNDAVQDIILWMEYTKFPKEKISLRNHIEEMKKRSYFVGEDVAEYLGKVVAWKNRT